MITPSVGGHHDQSFAILQVDKGGGSRFTASSPCGRQEQGPASDYSRADESSRVTVDELMELEVGNLQRSRGGVAQFHHLVPVMSRSRSNIADTKRQPRPSARTRTAAKPRAMPRVAGITLNAMSAVGTANGMVAKRLKA